MHIFIDESGGFQCIDRPAAISCVGAALVPGRRLHEMEEGFRELTQTWPRDEHGEIKGRLLQEPHFKQLCEFLEPLDVLFECSVTDTAYVSEGEIAYHRHMQAEGMTKHLTPEHRPSLVARVAQAATGVGEDATPALR